jgi:hypothetical protein
VWDMAAQAKGSGRPKGRPGPAKPQPRPASPAQPTAQARPSAQPKPSAQAKSGMSRAPVPGASPAPETGAPLPSSLDPAPRDPVPSRPAGLRLAAAAELIEAAGLCVAAVFAGVLTADGKSHQATAGIGLTVLALGTAAGLAAIAVGLARARPWSRTPAGMTQLFAVIAGIVLLDGHRPEWGVPALVLAAACMVGLLTPASLRALNRPPVKTQ